MGKITEKIKNKLFGKKKKPFNPKPEPDKQSHPDNFVRLRVACNFINYKNLVVFDVPRNATVKDLLEKVGNHFQRDPNYLYCLSCEQKVGYFEKTKQNPCTIGNDKKVISLGPEDSLKVEVKEHESI